MGDFWLFRLSMGWVSMRLQGVELVIVLPAASAARTELASDCVDKLSKNCNALQRYAVIVGRLAELTQGQSLDVRAWPLAPKSKRVATTDKLPSSVLYTISKLPMSAYEGSGNTCMMVICKAMPVSSFRLEHAASCSAQLQTALVMIVVRMQLCPFDDRIQPPENGVHAKQRPRVVFARLVRRGEKQPID
ncbi:hypothetical protein V8C44DRAFT_353385 [Trichoderma aethiopicum]